MRDNTIAFRDSGGHLLFASANEVFWRIRFAPAANDPQVACYKDTMPGPDGHVAGTPLDPVSWTGTWKDTRWSGRKPENTLTGTDFRMNGILFKAAVISSATYGAHPFWRNTSVVTTNLTTGAGIVGFEADQIVPTQPAANRVTLASTVINVDGSYADDNGQNYTGAGNLNPWGIIAQHFPSGAVVVGFGTCQWSWGLDATHDNGSNIVSTAIQQATLNLLADLGAPPTSTMAGLTTPTPVSNLDVYGIDPRPKAGTGSGGYSWASTVVGTRASRGSAPSTYRWAASATGSRIGASTKVGSVSGAYRWATTAKTGKRIPAGTVAPRYSWSGSVTGQHGIPLTVIGWYAE
jgi:hypothetical protein